MYNKYELQNKKYINLTDSMSTIASLINISNDNIIVRKIIKLTNKFKNYVIFSWIPGHRGISGYERAGQGNSKQSTTSLEYKLRQ